MHPHAGRIQDGWPLLPVGEPGLWVGTPLHPDTRSVGCSEPGLWVGTPLHPDTQPLCPDTQPLHPDTQPLYPDTASTQLLCPDTAPAGHCNSCNSAPTGVGMLPLGQ